MAQRPINRLFRRARAQVVRVLGRRTRRAYNAFIRSVRSSIIYGIMRLRHIITDKRDSIYNHFDWVRINFIFSQTFILTIGLSIPLLLNAPEFIQMSMAAGHTYEGITRLHISSLVTFFVAAFSFLIAGILFIIRCPSVVSRYMHMEEYMFSGIAASLGDEAKSISFVLEYYGLVDKFIPEDSLSKDMHRKLAMDRPPEKPDAIEVEITRRFEYWTNRNCGTKIIRIIIVGLLTFSFLFFLLSVIYAFLGIL